MRHKHKNWIATVVVSSLLSTLHPPQQVDRQTMGVMEKIKEIEAEMARTQKNKATNYHLGMFKFSCDE